jgi:hypothetical protein
MDANTLCQKLYSSKFNFSNELELQLGIEQLLISLPVHYQKEVIFSPEDRIDFLVVLDTEVKVGIEVKVDGSLISVTRQLWRYSQSSLADVLVLVTTRTKHRHQPVEINGKTIFVVVLCSL